MGNFCICKSCGCGRDISLYDNQMVSRAIKLEAVAKPPSISNSDIAPETASNQRSLHSHGFTVDMDEKTMQLLLNFDDSFSLIPQRKIQKDTQATQPQVSPNNNRLFEIQNVSDVNDFENSIRAKYDTDSSLSDGYHSSVCDAEKAEIEQFKKLNPSKSVTFSTPFPGSKAKVYRQGTGSLWDEEDIDDLHNEMALQLQDLTKRASYVEINELNESNQLSQRIVVPSNVNKEESLPNSSLYRDESRERWKKPLVDKKKQEMVKEMMHLAESLSLRKNDRAEVMGWNSNSDGSAADYDDY